jgi:regulator of replication initiation timing
MPNTSKKLIIYSSIGLIFVLIGTFSFLLYKNTQDAKISEFSKEIESLKTEIKNTKADNEFLKTRIDNNSITSSVANQPGTTTSEPKTEVEVKKEVQPKSELIEKGKEYQTQLYKFIITDYSFVKRTSPKYGNGKTAAENSSFIVIKIKITSTEKTNFNFSNDEQKDWVIADDKNRAFNTYEDSIGATDDYIYGTVFAPSIPQTKTLLFEVPDDAKDLSLATWKDKPKGILYLLKISR